MREQMDWGKNGLPVLGSVSCLQPVQDCLAVESGIGAANATIVGLIVKLAPGVGGQDDGGVGEADVAFEVFVFQTSGVENLEKEIDCVQVCLFNLVKEQHRIRVFFHETGEHARLRSLVTLLPADQRVLLLMIGIRAHVKPFERTAEMAKLPIPPRTSSPRLAARQKRKPRGGLCAGDPMLPRSRR